MMIYLIIGVVLVILIYSLIVYNNLIKVRNRVDEAFSTIDVYLKKRWDLIPNLVEVVKGYMKHEKNTLKDITELRKNVYEEMSNDDKVMVNNKLTHEITKVFALAEDYPELKANESFINLSDKIMLVENDIANSRKYYNGAVRVLNDKVLMFPGNIIAKMFGFKTRKMFEAGSEERNDINISL